MPADLQAVVQRMVEAGEPEDNIRLVIEHYGQAPPPKATPPPASATIGMLQPSTAKSDPGRASLFGIDLGDRASAAVNQPFSNEQVMGEGIGPFPTAGLIAGVRGIPGILARAGGISKVRAGENIGGALQAAKDAGLTVDLSNAANTGLRAVELKAAKFRVPQAVTSMVERVTGPNTAPYAAQEAHDLASNLSEQSINEINAIKRPVRRIATQVGVDTRQALIDALNTIDKGNQYASGVKEYHRAAVAGKYAKNAAKVGAGAATTYLGAGWLRHLLTGN